MMRLRYSPTSPFARKVRTAAGHLGLPLDLELADTGNESDTLMRQNPLGKLPVLLDGDRAPLFDSPVILAWLDHKAGGGKILPTETDARFEAMRLEALADGIMDATLLVVYEQRFRPESVRFDGWTDRQKLKVSRALAALNADVAALGSAVTTGTIALACALEYADLRLGRGWREGNDALVEWLAAFHAACPSFATTAPPAA
ncbi:MAG: hypothetical protein B7X99_03960 [Rhizobiales bacterium 17-65-6]|nr:MAG: hypothetical protein B7Z30_10545 [Rhizobiales bacterium 12-68-15]OYX89219.1 MAG: hypothetical protein B7Y84_06065 [Azorhizobium sp. 32-67-21]OZA00478.1 MAG: hypothetical protein B7X99_03960 [Rhizobiales bacterium 17-65-6]